MLGCALEMRYMTIAAGIYAFLGTFDETYINKLLAILPSGTVAKSGKAIDVPREQLNLQPEGSER